ncbi:MAG: hypothetical protein HYY63_05465, partial [Elusimicrobia bacterium]|nr:hypothetical protein [Elusimicrobiota bacterium]
MGSLSLRFDILTLLFILVLSTGFILFYRGFSRWSLLLRVSSASLLLWHLLQPSVSSFSKPQEKPTLAVLVDTSRSMGIQDPEERLSVVKKLLQSSVPSLEKVFRIRYYSFSANSALTDLKTLLQTRPEGKDSNILGALEEVRHDHRPLAVPILLFSDGSQHATILENETPLNFPAPLYTVGIGNEKGLNDIAITQFRGSDFAFKGQESAFSIEIRNRGFQNKKVPVILSEKKGESYREIAEQETVFSSNSGETEVQFRFVPQGIGRITYKIEVPPQPAEMSNQNNALQFQLDVGRRKLRVLYLCGQPSPEYAFLRQILKTDPSIELVSFVILRNPDSIVPVPEDQLSLIPFPTQEIFTQTLPQFDLLIFENFSYSRLGISREHLDNIRRFVEETGGGFLMVGGENSFGMGGYQGTPIETILPITLDPARETIEENPISLKPVEIEHPILNLGETNAETENIWKKMPPVNGIHKIAGIKTSASLIATARENGTPALVCWQRGKGRVAAMPLFSTWQWALKLAHTQGFQSHYIQFWRGTIRWLTTSEITKKIRIVLGKQEFFVGEKAPIKILLTQEKMKSLKQFDLELKIFQNGQLIQPIPLT